MVGQFARSLTVPISKPLQSRFRAPSKSGEATVAKAFGDLLRNGVSSLVMAILGDSTGVGVDRWVFLLSKAFAAAFKNAGVRYLPFDDASQTYPTRLSFNEHAVTAGVLRFADNFGRADGAVGTVSSGGQTWAANTWQIVNGKGKSDTDAASGLFTAATGQRDVIVSADFVLNAGATVSLSARRNGSNSVLTTAVSTALINLTGRFGSATTVVFGSFDSAALGLVVGETYRLSLWAVGTSFGMSIVGTGVDASLLGTIDASQDAALTGTVCGLYSNRAAVLWDNIVINSATASGELPRLDIYNGSVSGATIAYHASRLTATLPVMPHIVVISLSHNQGDQTPEAFIAEYVALVTAARERWPGVPILVLLQNPQNGTVGAAAHAARMALLRQVSPSLGYAVADAFTAFMDDARGISALILGGGDNVHPNGLGSRVIEQVVAGAFLVAA